MKETARTSDLDLYTTGDVYYVARVKEDGNMVPATDPRSREPDEGIVDLSKSGELIWSNRPAVIIGKDDGCQDSVLVAFLSKKAMGPDRELIERYKKFSPVQVRVNSIGGSSAALCSHVTRANLDNLIERMGRVTQDELDRIVSKIQKSGEFDEIVPFLHRTRDIDIDGPHV